MKIISQKSKDQFGILSSMIDFDKLDSIDDVKAVMRTLTKAGIQVDKVTVRELGDYEEAPSTIVYAVDAIDQIAEDFATKVIEMYTLIGHRDTYKVTANIIPNANRLIIQCKPQMHEEMNTMLEDLQKSEMQAEDTKTNTGDPYTI